ncbi:MAG TPA: prolyl oligopeptidase family serine peptidase [Thermoanaerobaculia bacterium]|jgi:predicted peptidase
MTLFTPHEVAVDGIPTIYRLYVPPDLPSPAPLILFLHGAGESGVDGVAQTTVGIGPAIRRDRGRFPALVVFPQASRGYGWRGFNLAAAVAALEETQRMHDVDPQRIVVTGISMGGYGTWRLALEQPRRFAALVPVCGGLEGGFGLQESARRLAHIPQWVFHGDADTIIPVEQSRRMVEALRAAGADVRYSEYPRVQHNSWDRAYAEKELVPWMLGQTAPRA